MRAQMNYDWLSISWCCECFEIPRNKTAHTGRSHAHTHTHIPSLRVCEGGLEKKGGSSHARRVSYSLAKPEHVVLCRHNTENLAQLRYIRKIIIYGKSS